MTDKKELPAFPHQKEDGSPYWGMSLRDYFAAKALQGWIASFTSEDGKPNPGHCADLCYEIADAMMEARGK